MVQNMKESGGIIKQMAKANSGMLMEMCMKENGKMTKQMAMECIYM